MAKIKFTDKTIQSLKAQPKVKDYFDKDREHGQGAFCVRVSPKGKKVFYLSYRSHGKSKLYKIGVYPDMSLAQARKTATKTVADVESGNDPKDVKKRALQEKKEQEARKTMTDLWDAYKEARKVDNKTTETLKEEDRKWKAMIEPILGDMKVADITHPIIHKMLKDVAKRTPTNANRLYSLLRIMFTPALDAGWIDHHPMVMMKKPGGTETERKRVLSDIELKKLWSLFDAELQTGNIFKLILLTAQRPGEVMGMHWNNIDMENHTWTQTETKNGSIHVVPLSSQVMTILEIIRPSKNTDRGYVFPSPRSELGHIKNIHKARLRLHKESDIKGWTNHDLRRTGRTIMSRLNIKQHIRERVLNHSQGGMVKVYDQYDYLQEKADALDKLGREIDRIIGVESSTNGEVVQLRRQA